MANVIKTVITYPLNGSTRDFNIPFEYLARKFVQVTLIGRDRKPLTNIDDYRFTSKNQITTNRAWGTGDGYQLIELRRFTSATERLVDFSDGSILRAYDLNVSQIQTLHVAEEARDLTADTIGVNNEGHLDARGRRIVNLADPVNDLDAVNLKTIKEWNNGAYQSYLKAKEEAEKAARSATAAKTSETNAHSHMTQAGISEQRSKASETSAKNSKNAAAASAKSAAQSAGSASNSAQEATGAKEYTKQQADRSYNEAERAKGYADSMGNTIDIGKVIESINTTNNSVRWKGDHYFGEVSIGGLGAVNRTVLKYDAGGARLSQNTGNGWRVLTFPYENGTVETRENIGRYLREDTAKDWIVLAESLKVRPNGRAELNGQMHVTSAITVAKDLSGTSDSIGVYIKDSGGVISQYSNGWKGEWKFGYEGNVDVASRQWVQGSALGNEFRYRTVSGKSGTSSLFEGLSNIPAGHMFTRLKWINDDTTEYYCRKVF